MAGVTTPRSAAYDALLSTTLDKYYKSGKMHDAIFNSNPTIAMLRQKGKIQYADGGYQIAVNLMYGQNTTVGTYSGYEVLDVAPQDGMTQAFYPWAQIAGSVSIDGLSEFQNSGVGKIIDLVGEKVEQTTMTLSEKLNEQMLDIEDVTIATGVTGNGGKNFIGIPLFCHIDPTTSHVIGGITCDTDAPVNAWWGNQYLTFGATDTVVAFRQQMRRIYNLSSKGTGGAPDVMLFDMYSFEHYMQAVDDKQRYVYKEDRVSQDFGSLYYLNARCFWDAHMPDMSAAANHDGSFADGTIFALNTKFLKFMVGKGKDFKWTKFQKPEDQDARVANCFLYGQLVCSNRRKQGVLFDIEDGTLA